ncbi:MAG: bifunctional riboflavin kinase/FAD synthetase [Bacteroidia bacterium]
MKIYKDIAQFEAVNKPILTIGTFDGVHLGHKKILNRLKELKSLHDGETVVFTFDPHPRTVLFPEQKDLKLITTTAEKTALVEEAGIDHLIIYPFSKEFALLSSEEYIKEFLVARLHTRILVIGYDHRFGHNREGNIDTLKKFSHDLNYTVEEIPAHDIDSINISSTRIRRALEEGNVNSANTYLGYPYFFTGKVVEGKKLGRTIGYPTVNIEVESSLKLLPAIGVYAVTVEFEGRLHKGMLSIGVNPTTDDDGKIKLEVNIFELNENLYTKQLRVNVHSRLRNEEKFANLEELKKQLEVDQINALQALSAV